MRPVVLAAMAVADFRERVRRPAYIVVLLAAVCLGYLAVPAVGDHWTIVNAGSYRGVYDSAYVGTVTALAGALWLSAGGFYVIRSAVARDRQSGVGELLAATPMRTGDYLIGKFLSNLLVLSSMAATLAAAALAMQLARGESRSVDLVALLAPFVLCTLPVLAVAAAAAVVFETTPLLRGGLGNIIWLVVSLIGLIAGQSADAPFGGLGVGAFAESLRDELAARGLKGTDLALGLMYMDDPPRPVPWDGIDFTAAFAGKRMALIALAVGVALVPALWFDRFDQARRTAPAAKKQSLDRAVALRSAAPRWARPAPVATPLQPLGPPGPPANGVSSSGVGRHRSAAEVLTAGESGVHGPWRAAGALRVVAGEVRILAGGVSRWWWLGTLALVVAGVAVPSAAPVALMAAWIWPVLIWSRLGCQAREQHAEALLDSCPAPLLRTLAQWLSGVVLTAVVSFGPALAMAADGHFADWLAGAAFIPALALAAGVISRTQRLFQAAYPLLWYMVVNDVAGLDYMGVLAGGPQPLIIATAAALLLLAALAVVALRHRLR
ncbi:ABC transporter permease [Paractinoplanes deccanensis]|uniref:ABC transporter permease n=1 Tax=Paractinoplanes deccanensis TaxID=113561 RepID=A0ABQ3XX22_9ACTN|nr:hypothetical protein [Actinoplanes deccanensis]GID72260.1 ABC transporter permease [Actinoplanes deccanensis]